MANLISHKYTVKARLVVAEAGIGLLAGWWFLLLLELMRPGFVSLYIDLNFILVLGLVGFLFGRTELHQPIIYTRLQMAISAILAIGVLIAVRG